MLCCSNNKKYIMIYKEEINGRRIHNVYIIVVNYSQSQVLYITVLTIGKGKETIEFMIHASDSPRP